MIIRPPPLSSGATLGVIATSSPIDEGGQALVERGYDRLREKGFEVVEAPNCRRLVGHAAGTVAERVEALHGFFADPGIDGIISFWGGQQTHQLLEHLDWELIARNPKVLVGYSDTTSLLNAITHRTGLVTFCGPAVITFAKPTLFDYSWRWFRRVLMEGGASLRYEASPVCSDNAWYERDDEQMIERPAPGWRCFRPGHTRGPIVGGHLGTLLLLAATPYWPEMQGRILFAEASEGDSPERLDRMFTQLRQMGVLDALAGLIVGRVPASAGFSPEDSLEMILETALEGIELPVLLDIDFGHTDPLFAFPLGVSCALDADRGGISLCEPWLASSG